MATESVNRMIQHLRRAVLRQEEAHLTDAELLGRFVRGRDEAAFEALVRRHGAMVLGVCRRVLRNEADAADAFQATFLVLIRKAASIRSAATVSNWLYGVAHNTALKAKATDRKRRTKEREAGSVRKPEAATDVGGDVQALLDTELSRLPDKYRIPIVLCDLEGKTIKEAALHLGWPQGTAATRRARGHALLAKRLTKQGLIFSAGVGPVVLSQGAAPASVPPALLTSSLKAAHLVAAGQMAAVGLVSARVAALTEGVVRAMFLTKIKFTGAMLMTVVVATGLGGLVYQLQAAEQKPLQTNSPAPAITANTLLSAQKDERLTMRGWGAALDPAGDCKFTVGKNKLTMVVPASDHALCIERGQMNAPRVLQEVEGNFILQVKVSGDYPGATKSLVETRIAFHGAGLLLWQDEKNYVRLEKAQLCSSEVSSYVSWELRKDGEFVRMGNTGDAPIKAKEMYLRIERRKGQVLGFVSLDGNQWTALEPIAVNLSRKVKAGIVAGQNTSTGFSPEFSELKLFREVGN